MNKILWGLINTREVASFIDDVIVWIKEGEGHDEVVEEVVKKLVENDLYVKLENILVVIKGLKNWKHLLEDAKFKFEVWTDCKNLEYFMKV